MRTPKQLYPTERCIYQPEQRTCLQCGGPLQLANYLVWDKLVQTLTTIQSVASRPAFCADPACAAYRAPVRSAAAQRLALPGSSYGFDVLVRIGWWRQQHAATFVEVAAALPPHLCISPTHLRYLYQQCYLPLLACTARPHQAALTQAVQRHGGLLLALDGLAPEGGEPQLWCVHELLTGLTLRCGWLSQQDQATFEAFLQPLTATPWPVRAVLSDKQRGLVPAVAACFPTAVHQFCQAHYLRQAALLLATADSALAVTLRKAVRQEVGTLLRDEAAGSAAGAGVLTVTGLVPDPPAPLPGAPPVPAPAAAPAAPLAPADPATALVTQLARRVRYLLTLTGRPPTRWAGLDLAAGLHEIVTLGTELLAHRPDARLAALVHGVQHSLAAVAPTLTTLRQGAAWLQGIATILDAASEPHPTGSEVARQLAAYLAALPAAPDDPWLTELRAHLRAVSARYAPGLFHCYDQVALPRTNNELESRFREVQRRLLRTSGQKGRTRRTLHRLGAWELLPRPASEADLQAAFPQVAGREFAAERRRVRDHQERFRLHTRAARRAKAQLGKIRQQWLALPPAPTGLL